MKPKSAFLAKNRNKGDHRMNTNDQEFLIQKIRSSYTEKEYTALDELKALDAKVKRPANVFAYVFGSISALIMGSGMSLTMTDIAQTLGIPAAMPIGIAVGCMGLLMAVLNYPFYKRVLNARRKKYANTVIALSDSLLQS